LQLKEGLKGMQSWLVKHWDESTTPPFSISILENERPTKNILYAFNIRIYEENITCNMEEINIK